MDVVSDFGSCESVEQGSFSLGRKGSTSHANPEFPERFFNIS